MVRLRFILHLRASCFIIFSVDIQESCPGERERVLGI